MTRIALILHLADHQQAEVRLERARLTQDDLVELRLDSLPETASVWSFWEWLSTLPLPRGGVILTARRPEDGGRFHGTEAQRLRLLGRVVEATVGARTARAVPIYVDLECDPESGLPLPGTVELAAQAREHGVVVLWSLHSFTGLPDTQPLQALAERASDFTDDPAGDQIKLAAMVNGDAELGQLLDFRARLPTGRHVVIGMGIRGRMTRDLAGVLGNAWTYAHDDEGPQPAPGVPSLSELLEGLRIHGQRPGDPWFAVAGNPVDHSLSPEWHNRRLAAAGLSASYTRLQPETLETLLPWMREGGLAGLSVTVPFKEAALRLADCATDSARLAGAANTLIRVGRRVVAHNTDIAGFLAPLRGRGLTLKGRSALILGAGGAARGVAVALAAAGARMHIWNRSFHRAEELAADLRARLHADAAPTADPADIDLTGPVDLVVQATPVGLPSVPGDPAPQLLFRQGQWVYDLNYRDTELLRRARTAGAQILDGGEMFAAQAELQAELFCRVTGGVPRSGKPEVSGPG